MKRKIPMIILAAAVFGGFSLANARGDADDKPAEKKDAAPTSHIKQDTNGNTVVTLDDATQKRIALKIEPLAAAKLSPEVKTYGRVLDPAPLAALMMELASAQAAYTASSNELARLRTLSGSGNASARALQTAEAGALHDQLQMQSARDRLQLSWGKSVTEQTDLPAFIQSLTSLNTVLIRVDLPGDLQLDSPPAAARVTPLAGGSVPATVLGAAMTVDPQTQGHGFILEITNNQSRFLPGEAVTGWLQTPGAPLEGVVVPRDAIVRLEGAGWVYESGAGGAFTREEIALDRPVQSGWFVTNGIAANDAVVVVGAQSLLSEELKAATGAPGD